MKLLTKEQRKSYKMQNLLYICKEKINMLKMTHIVKVGTIVVVQVNKVVLHTERVI